MLCKVCLVLMCILAFTAKVYNKPIIESGAQECIQQGCPEHTFACATTSKLSEDKKNIINKMQCFGVNDKVLQNITTTEKNPFGPDVFYQGFRYSGAYGISYSGSGTHHIDKSDKDSNYGEADDLNNNVEVY